jgi:hypothetical protein
MRTQLLGIVIILTSSVSAGAAVYHMCREVSHTRYATDVQ